MDLQLMRLRKEARYNNCTSIASALGASEKKHRSWETEGVRLTLEDARKIAGLLHCTLEELASRSFQSAERFDQRQQLLNYSYSPLDDRSKDEFAGIASMFTADASRLAAYSGHGASVGAETVRRTVRIKRFIAGHWFARHSAYK